MRYSRPTRLTCNVEFGRRDLVLDLALVKSFVFAANVGDTQLTLLAVLYAEVFRIVDVNRLQRHHSSSPLLYSLRD